MSGLLGAVLLIITNFWQQESPAPVPALNDALDSADAQISTFIAGKRKEELVPNRLIHEKSPYLQQHAFNPVDWYPWGDEAFKKAEVENKPIFLSVGYSTCYWCHVMERTVFERDSLAALMNEYFVNIKVDREERPDVDRVYMQALQAMAGSGGWPMSLFLTPDLKPFFGATYVPPEAAYGRPGFGDLARRIHRAWAEQREMMTTRAENVATYLQKTSLPRTEPMPVEDIQPQAAFDWYAGNFDAVFGGFGSAPKFPRPASLDFLMDYYESTGNEQALEMALNTLRDMAAGGMYDHVGYGFHRYSTDARWHVPHFEKMLYDQAQLVISYVRAFELAGDSLFLDVARDVLAYVDRTMLHEDGGFYSAEDAESAVSPERPEEKEEGASYTWTKAEIDRLLEPEAARIFNFVYGVETDGNVEQDPHGEFVGENILYEAHDVEEASGRFGLSSPEVASNLERSRRLLLAAREKRPKPYLDDKILLSWNGLMIAAYANAFDAFGVEHYRDVAERSARFLLDRLYDEDGGVLRRRYRAGEARYNAHLEDYANFVHGLIDLYEATGDEGWLNRAEEFTGTMVDRFYDPEQGGFYATAGDDESILVRSKEYYDGAEPSGNSVAILNLVRLYEITGRDAYRQKARESLAYFGQIIHEGPTSPMMLRSLLRMHPDG
jgi:uncharacterized protein YyaL (SSP411 family)